MASFHATTILRFIKPRRDDLISPSPNAGRAFHQIFKYWPKTGHQTYPTNSINLPIDLTISSCVQAVCIPSTFPMYKRSQSYPPLMCIGVYPYNFPNIGRIYPIKPTLRAGRKHSFKLCQCRCNPLIRTALLLLTATPGLAIAKGSEF